MCWELGVEFGAGMLARGPYHSRPHIVLPHLCAILSSDRCRTQEATCWCQHPDATLHLGLSSTALTPRLLGRARRPGQCGEAVLCSLLPGRLKGKINAEVLQATNPPPVFNSVPPLSFQTTFPSSAANAMCHQHGNHVMCFIVMRKPSVSPESPRETDRDTVCLSILCVIFNFFL